MKLKLTAAAIAALMLAMPAHAEATAEQLAAIDAKLKEMSCEVDHDNVEMEGTSFDLDDVICADGQYDIMMDANYEVTNRRKE